MIIDIRGTNGAGKSHLVRQFLKNAVFAVKTELGYDIPSLELCVIGHYENPTGGCDQIKPKHQVQYRIEKALETFPNVIFEGKCESMSLQFARLAQKHKEYWFCFLDTSLEDCIRQRNKRREESGRLQEGRTDDVLIRDFQTIHRRKRQLDSLGLNTLWIPHGSGYEFVLNLLKKGTFSVTK